MTRDITYQQFKRRSLLDKEPGSVAVAKMLLPKYRKHRGSNYFCGQMKLAVKMRILLVKEGEFFQTPFKKSVKLRQHHITLRKKQAELSQRNVSEGQPFLDPDGKAIIWVLDNGERYVMNGGDESIEHSTYTIDTIVDHPKFGEWVRPVLFGRKGGPMKTLPTDPGPETDDEDESPADSGPDSDATALPKPTQNKRYATRSSRIDRGPNINNKDKNFVESGAADSSDGDSNDIIDRRPTRRSAMRKPTEAGPSNKDTNESSSDTPVEAEVKSPGSESTNLYDASISPSHTPSVQVDSDNDAEYEEGDSSDGNITSGTVKLINSGSMAPTQSTLNETNQNRSKELDFIKISALFGELSRAFDLREPPL